MLASCLVTHLLVFINIFLTFADDPFTFNTQLSQDFTNIYTVVNGQAKIPCNVSLNSKDEILVILWFKNSNAIGPPIYTLDFRENNMKHFSNHSIMNRAQFSISTQPPILVLTFIEPQDEGIYHCRADYKWSRTQSSLVYLHVAVPPKQMYIIDSFGHTVYAIAGPYAEDSNINLTCIAKNGKPAPRLLWYLNDALIDDSYRIQENASTKGNITVENVLSIPRLDRSYFNVMLTCQAVNVYYSSSPLSTSLRIDMHLKPAGISIMYIKMPLIENKRVNVVCKTWGSKPRSKIVWLLKDKPLKRIKLVHDKYGNSSTSILTFNPFAHDNGHQLICKSINYKLPTNSELEASLILKILYKPKIDLQIVGDDKYALNDKTVILKCLVDANPSVNSVEWFYKQSLIPPRLNIELKNYTLSILKATPEHEGKYSCKANNSQGVTFSEPLYLNIYYPPKCKNSSLEASYHLSIGQPFTFHCSVNAYPVNNLTFEWTLVSNKLPNVRRPLTNFTSRADESWLHLNPSNLDDFGSIYCLAKNVAGQQLEPCLFIIKPIYELPKPPKDCRLINESRYFLVECETGQDSKMDQMYYLEVFEAKSSNLVLTLKENKPKFKVELKENKSIHQYFIIVYSKNYYGKSDDLNITIQYGTHLMLNRVVTSSGLKFFKIKVSYILIVLLLGFVMVTIVLMKRRRNRSKRDSSQKDNHEKQKKTNRMTSVQSLIKDTPKMNDNETPKSLDLFENAIFQTPDVIDLSCNTLRLYDKGSTICQPNSLFLTQLNDDTANLRLTGINDISNSKQNVFYVTTLV